MPFNKLAFRKAVKDIHRRATGFVLLAILFLVIGILQDIFASYQIHKTTTLELNGWANEIANEIYKGKWDWKAYEQAYISAPAYYVFSDDGLLIDIESPAPELLTLFRSVRFPANSIFVTPETFTSAVGEKLRLMGRKILGGAVVVGFEEPSNLEMADRELATNLTQFGSTLDEAVALSPRKLNQDIEYAVVSDSGELKSGLGGVGLKIDPTPMLTAARTGKPVKIGSQIYLLIAKPILDSTGKILGTIIVPKDITAEQRILNQQWMFNLVLSTITFGVAVLIALYFVGREIIRHSYFETLPKALDTPENLKKEFKGSFQWDIGRNCRNLEERLKTLKTIVAFLNSAGGVLFIGVNDNRTIRGIKEDLELFNGSIDKFQLQIRDLISDRIGAEFAPLIKIHCESVGEKIVCVVEVEKAIQPAFLKEDKDNKSHFYKREDGRTKELDSKETFMILQSKR